MTKQVPLGADRRDAIADAATAKPVRLIVLYVVLAVLTVGFAYEWKKGALEWD